MTECIIAKIPKNIIVSVLLEDNLIFKELNRITDEIDSRYKFFHANPKKEKILQFIIENNLTYATRLKISLLDKCINCNACYEACYSRFKNVKLTRRVLSFGVIDVVQSCRNCLYPHCIYACKFNSLIRSSETGEIEVLDTCTGCSACVRACPFESIKLIEKPRNFPKSNNTKIPKISSKCEHCAGYESEACIISCPTGALQNIDMMDLIYKPEIFSLFTKDNIIKKELKENKFHDQPVGERNFAQSIVFAFQIFLLILFFLCFGFELITKKFNLSYTLSKTFFNLGLLNVNNYNYLQSKIFIHHIGDIVGVMTLATLFYPLYRLFPKISKSIMSALSWFDWHIFLGLASIIFLIFHFSFKPIGLLGMLMLISLGLIIISGALGRYLYVSIPQELADNELKINDLEMENDDLTHKLEIIFSDNEKNHTYISKMTSVLILSYPNLDFEITGFKSLLKFSYKLIYGSFFILFNDFIKAFRMFKIRLFIPNELKIHGYQLREFMRIINTKAKIKRNIALLKTLKQFSQAWYMLHKPCSYIFFYLLAIHVFVSIVFR
jgi:Fe-S-cluster-containing hydrogenase component 2